MIFALIGEESLLVRRDLEKLLSQRVPATAREFNFDTLTGSEVQARRVLEMARTLPVLASRRVILIKEADEIKKGEMETLEPLLKEVPEETDLIFVASKADRRLSFWKAIEKVGKVREYKPLDFREAPRWIEDEAKSAGYRIGYEVAQWMVTALGMDLSLLHSTLEKLYLLMGDKKEIQLPDVESCVMAFSWKSVFELTDTVGQKDLARALTLFHRMYASGESPIALVALIGRHFRILSKVKEGRSAGLPPYFLSEYKRQADRFQTKDLESKREKIFHTDWALKRLSLDPTIVFEKLLMDLCR